MAKTPTKDLIDIDPDRISKNPVNPRLIFREGEMNQLLDSIREVGIQVPLAVYRGDGGFVLLDGERRWRCARKLNLPTVPVLVQPEPSPLENLLTMFNIHNVRTDWDLMPMALKLRDVQLMLEDADQDSSAKALSGLTGVSLPTVRRALDLLDLPKRYQEMLLKEAEKPRDQQAITADLFVEVTKSRRAVEKYQPDVFDEVTPAKYLDAMVEKYRAGVVKNVVRFRDVSKIARAERAGGDPESAGLAIVRLVEEKTYSIEEAYEDTVASAYTVRDLDTRVTGLSAMLDNLDRRRKLPLELRKALAELRDQINELLGK